MSWSAGVLYRFSSFQTVEGCFDAGAAPCPPRPPRPCSSVPVRVRPTPAPSSSKFAVATPPKTAKIHSPCTQPSQPLQPKAMLGCHKDRTKPSPCPHETEKNIQHRPPTPRPGFSL